MFAKLNPLLQMRLQLMRQLLYCFGDEERGLTWTSASEDVAKDAERGVHLAKQMRKWAQAFIDT